MSQSGYMKAEPDDIGGSKRDAMSVAMPSRLGNFCDCTAHGNEQSQVGREEDIVRIQQ